MAVVVGALTHIVWDAFTHEGARGVRLFPLLDDFGPEVAGHSLELYRWLQYGSSLLGLAVVSWALWLWAIRTPQPSDPPIRVLAARERRLWIAGYALIPALATGGQWLLLLRRGVPWLPSGDVLVRLLIAATGSLLGSLVLVSVLIQMRLRAQTRADLG
jgi:hypothetical protein